MCSSPPFPSTNRWRSAGGVRSWLDGSYVRTWLIQIVGKDDERVARWDRIVADVVGAG